MAMVRPCGLGRARLRVTQQAGRAQDHPGLVTKTLAAGLTAWRPAARLAAFSAMVTLSLTLSGRRRGRDVTAGQLAWEPRRA